MDKQLMSDEEKAILDNEEKGSKGPKKVVKEKVSKETRKKDQIDLQATVKQGKEKVEKRKVLRQEEEDQEGVKVEKREWKIETQNKVITLRGVYGKFQGNCKLRPPFLRTGEVYTGQGNPTEEEKRHMSYVITPKTLVTVFDGFQLDLSKEQNAANWKWMEKHPFIAESFDMAQSSEDALFYIEDLDRDMDRKATGRTLILEAMKILENASEAKKRDIMMLMGQDAKYFNFRQINDFLGDKAMQKPADLIAAVNNPDFAPKLLLFKLMDAKRIELRDGVYLHGGRVIAATESQAIEWLKLPTNNDVVTQLMQLVGK